MPFCWAFKDKETFADHGIGVLNFFRDNFSYIIPILARRAKLDEEVVRKSVELGVALHDIGKISLSYSDSYYGHEFYSGYIIYKLLERCCNSSLNGIVSIAVMNHHQAMAGRTLREMTIHGEYKKLQDFRRKEECKEDVERVFKALNVNLKFEDIPKKIGRDNVKCWFMNLRVERVDLYVIILGSLMVADTVVANKNRGGQRRNLIIDEYSKWLSL
ncbi:CRISPR-associated endonuclease Cas3'' [Saccharolobus caldissimus]|uniref:CRISPR-associated endonuclease Cas3 n=1 Tax=Saccharolobus caldissimus TaxID=1702097 RepID=A0AAQ4CRV0_9CREN|nr:CRISPR-associated endonuclease Cas3'' [Saccharolobus caldissimus]BDB98531.1 CRISPR-associated endonuclease Cas3'' [Saccharolobus caldissimus]